MNLFWLVISSYWDTTQPLHVSEPCDVSDPVELLLFLHRDHIILISQCSFEYSHTTMYITNNLVWYSYK